MSRKCKFELADSLGFQGEPGVAYTCRLDRDGFLSGVIDEREPIVGLKLKVHVPAGIRVVVDSDWDRNAITLRERNWQIKVNEEILEHF
ncbi:MAG TPA: hypothetical protein VN939_12880, partial [Chthoniobacterales bacterium]|nr:hypothetical protein [Chthoniobacterales bacterium]